MCQLGRCRAPGIRRQALDVDCRPRLANGGRQRSPGRLPVRLRKYLSASLHPKPERCAGREQYRIPRNSGVRRQVYTSAIDRSLPGKVSYGIDPMWSARRQFDVQAGPGYTFGMKTAISLPDDVFNEAERFARRSRKTRSQLYAEAITEYLARHAPDDITERVNRVCDKIGTEQDSFATEAARQLLSKETW